MKFLDKLSRKRVFIFGLIFSFVVVFLFQKNIIFYLYENYNKTILDTFLFLRILLMIFVPIFIFSILSFFTSVEFFKKWLKFTFVYLIVYVFFVSIIPWNLGDIYIQIHKSAIAFYLSVLYLLTSIFFVIYYSIKSKKDLK